MTIQEFELIYNSYYPVAFKYCRHFNIPKEELEDAIMNVFATILHDLDKYRLRGIKSFIVTSARNQCIDLNRHNRLKDRLLKSAGEEVHDGQEQIEKKDMRKRVLALINQLPAQQQRVIALKYIHDQTREEMATHLNLSPNTIRNTLVDGIRNIKKRLK